MCGGGGGGGGSTQYNWNDDMAPYWRSALSQGSTLAQTPYQAYKGGDPNAVIAGFTPDQMTAMNQIRSYTTDPRYSVIDPNNAQNTGIMQESDTLSGRYLGTNPNAQRSNPYAGKSADLQTNQYAGMDSPYFKSTVQSGLDDMAQAYQRGTAADLAREATLGGVVGGSAYNNAQGANQYALAKQMSNYVSGMQNDQYTRSAGLQENAIGRDMTNQQFGLTSGNADVQSMIGMGNQDYENERQRQIATLNPTQNEQQLALQRAQALTGIGDAQQQQQQSLMNVGYNNFQQQRQYPYTQMDWLTGLMSRAQGGVSPNSSTQSSAYGVSPISGLLGAALVGSSFYH